MKNIIIGFVCGLVIVSMFGLGLFLFLNNKETGNPTNAVRQETKTVPSNTVTGLYDLVTFTYPKSWKFPTMQTDSAIAFMIIDESLPVSGGSRVSLMFDYDHIFLGDIPGREVQFQNSFSPREYFAKVDGYDVYVYRSKNDSTRKNTSYVVSLGKFGNENKDFDILVNVISERQSPGADAVLPDVESLVRSIKINNSKLKPVADDLSSRLGEAANAGRAASIKATLANLRAVGEIYYDSNNSSYTNVCTKSDSFISLKKNPSISNFICKDSPKGFAVTASLGGGKYWCVESTGFAGNATVLNAGTVCVR